MSKREDLENIGSRKGLLKGLALLSMAAEELQSKSVTICLLHASEHNLLPIILIQY